MLLSCHFRSPVLRRNTRINVILPTPEEEDAPLKKDLKVLYLLHGLHGDADSWLHFSNIQRYVQGTDIAVVMPSVGNSFYQDMACGERFFTYMTQELPKFIQGLFPVSSKREDTYLAGLSMGGYGAYFLGLRCPEQYGAVASLSGALDIGFRTSGMPVGPKVPKPFYVEACFGDMTKIAGSDRDVFTLYARAAAKGCLPRMYQSCGTADYLYEMNVRSHEALVKMGARITYRETPGMAHEWEFWDQEIRYVLDWLQNG